MSGSKGNGRSRGRGELRPSPSGPNLSERVPPLPSSSLNTYPDLPRQAPLPPRANTTGDIGTQPPSSGSMGFHDTQQRKQTQRKDSDSTQETLAAPPRPPEYNVSFAHPARNGSSPPDSVYSDLSQLKRTAPYAMMSDATLLNEPGPFDSISQRGVAMSDYSNTRPMKRAFESDDNSRRGYAPSAPPRGNSSNASFRQAASDSQFRQRMPSVMGSASEFLDGFDPDDRFSSSMSMVSDREATSEAWFQRQRIKPGRAKTKKVKLTKGRFIAEYGKRSLIYIGGTIAKPSNLRS